MRNAFVFILIVALQACGPKKSSGPGAEETLIKEEKPAGGIEWSYPGAWEKTHDMPMRVATYVAPSYMEDVDPAECAVFYFGKDQGGTVDDNIQRWGSQFEDAGQANKTSIQVEGMPVTLVRMGGTYLAPAGPMMESQGKKRGYKLLGAIVEGPQGMVFFKMTGPASLIEKSDARFESMIQSVRKK